MADAVYALCALISIACAVQLFRSHRRRPLRISLWVMTCFIFVALNNVLLFFDRVVATQVDLGLVRAGAAFVAALVLTFGLVWESK